MQSKRVETLCKLQPQGHWAEQIEEWSKPPGRDSNQVPTKSHRQSLKKLLELMFTPVIFKVLSYGTFRSLVYVQCTMAKFQWEVRHTEFWTLPLILSASKYFRLISLSLYPHPNISDKFLCHFIFVEDKMNNRPYPRYTCWGTKWTVVKHSLLFISQ